MMNTKAKVAYVLMILGFIIFLSGLIFLLNKRNEIAGLNINRENVIYQINLTNLFFISNHPQYSDPLSRTTGVNSELSLFWFCQHTKRENAKANEHESNSDRVNVKKNKMGFKSVLFLRSSYIPLDNYGRTVFNNQNNNEPRNPNLVHYEKVDATYLKKLLTLLICSYDKIYLSIILIVILFGFILLVFGCVNFYRYDIVLLTRENNRIRNNEKNNKRKASKTTPSTTSTPSPDVTQPATSTTTTSTNKTSRVITATTAHAAAALAKLNNKSCFSQLCIKDEQQVSSSNIRAKNNINEITNEEVINNSLLNNDNTYGSNYYLDTLTGNSANTQLNAIKVKKINVENMCPFIYEELPAFMVKQQQQQQQQQKQSQSQPQQKQIVYSNLNKVNKATMQFKFIPQQSENETGDYAQPNIAFQNPSYSPIKTSKHLFLQISQAQATPSASLAPFPLTVVPAQALMQNQDYDSSLSYNQELNGSRNQRKTKKRNMIIKQFSNESSNIDDANVNRSNNYVCLNQRANPTTSRDQKMLFMPIKKSKFEEYISRFPYKNDTIKSTSRTMPTPAAASYTIYSNLSNQKHPQTKLTKLKYHQASINPNDNIDNDNDNDVDSDEMTSFSNDTTEVSNNENFNSNRYSNINEFQYDDDFSFYDENVTKKYDANSCVKRNNNLINKISSNKDAQTYGQSPRENKILKVNELTDNNVRKIAANKKDEGETNSKIKSEGQGIEIILVNQNLDRSNQGKNMNSSSSNKVESATEGQSKAQV